MESRILWEYNRNLDIISPDGQTYISVHNTDERFVRALTHLLNETAKGALGMSHREMNERGVPHAYGR